MRATTGVAAAGGGLLAIWLGWVAWTGALTQRLPAPEPTTEVVPLGFPWRGAIHVHSDRSADASGTLEEIVAAAVEAGLDFVVIADHTQAQGSAARAHPGWHGSLLVVVAEELSTDEGHLLALGLRAHPYALGPTFRQTARDVERLGGQLLVAHPVGGESEWRGGFAGVAGMEVVSLSAALAGQSLLTRLGALLAYPASPEVAALRILRRRPEALALWDRETGVEGDDQPVPLVAIGSVDAHGPVALGAPSYAATFRSLNTVVWMDEPPGRGDRGAARRLGARLVEGRSAIVVTAAGAAPGLRVFARTPDGELALPGAVVRHARAGWRITAAIDAAAIDTAAPTRIVLLRDGAEVATSDSGALEFDAAEPGTYRVELFRLGGPAGGGRVGATPWVVTNPLFLWPDRAAATTRARPAPELPAPPDRWSLLALTGWAAESGDGAMSALGRLDDGLRWDLRMPQAAVAGSYAALAWRPEDAEDWRSAAGLAVALRSERPWRIALQLWTRDADARVTWEHVLASDPDGASRAVPWSWFRRTDAAGRRSRELLDDELSAVEGVVLVVTPRLMRDGSEAGVDLLDLGLFGGR